MGVVRTEGGCPLTLTLSPAGRGEVAGLRMWCLGGRTPSPSLPLGQGRGGDLGGVVSVGGGRPLTLTLSPAGRGEVIWWTFARAGPPPPWPSP